MDFKGYFKGLARVTRTFKFEYSGFKAQGVPAILVAVSGVVLAVGVAKALSQGAGHLPDTLKEARGLAEALRSSAPRLKS
ncbi:MAG: hypothetical protein ABI182_02625 [Candidatus Baltobacteraceae bacterium]